MEVARCRRDERIAGAGLRIGLAEGPARVVIPVVIVGGYVVVSRIIVHEDVVVGHIPSAGRVWKVHPETGIEKAAIVDLDIGCLRSAPGGDDTVAHSRATDADKDVSVHLEIVALVHDGAGALHVLPDIERKGDVRNAICADAGVGWAGTAPDASALRVLSSRALVVLKPRITDDRVRGPPK